MEKTLNILRLLTFLSQKYLVFLLFSFINKWVDQSARHSQHLAQTAPISFIFPKKAKKMRPGQNGIEKMCFKLMKQELSQLS